MLGEAVIERVRALVRAFLDTDLRSLRIEEENEDYVEIRRGGNRAQLPDADRAQPQSNPEETSKPVDAIKADLVGIVHFARPVPKEGERLGADRELAYVEALGIRNPVRSLGPGKIVAVRCEDGQPVEYGQVLFEVDRDV